MMTHRRRSRPWLPRSTCRAASSPGSRQDSSWPHPLAPCVTSPCGVLPLRWDCQPACHCHVSVQALPTTQALVHHSEAYQPCRFFVVHGLYTSSPIAPSKFASSHSPCVHQCFALWQPAISLGARLHFAMLLAVLLTGLHWERAVLTCQGEIPGSSWLKLCSRAGP